MAYDIRPFDAAADTGAFCCGQSNLDAYIRRYASQDVRRRVARVFVATPREDARRLAGFYSLSAGSVSCTELPPEMARKLPRYPVPVALLGRLAVDQAFRGQGLGAILLSDACQKVVSASHALAVAAIVVDAKDAPAAEFYRHFGFVPLPGRAERLLLPWTVVYQVASASTHP
jgi:GNAT superfamily N-acetyltransferase